MLIKRVHKVDASDLMRRMVKEELVKFDGTPLFPERRAYTVNYPLSEIEAALYEAVTEYVLTEMGKADQLAGARKGSVGFALTTLQRRLASSPEAIYQSLKRRKERLESRLWDEKLGIRGRKALAETLADTPEDDDDLNAEEQENLEETLIDQATAAQTVTELEAEIEILMGLEEQARAVVASGQDRKWDELSKILQDNPEMRDASGRQRKLIIFSEHRDTLNYLHDKIAGVLGNHDAIIIIHGGTHRDERRRLQTLFWSDPEVRVLVAYRAVCDGHERASRVQFDPLRENEVASKTLASSDDTRSVPATMKPKSMTMGERPAAVRLSCLTCRAVRILAFRSESLVISVKCLFINRGPV